MVLQQNYLWSWLSHSLVYGLPMKGVWGAWPQVVYCSCYSCFILGPELSWASSFHDRWKKHKRPRLIQQAHLKPLFMAYLLTYHWPKKPDAQAQVNGGVVGVGMYISPTLLKGTSKSCGKKRACVYSSIKGKE